MAKVDSLLRWLDSFTPKGQITIGDLVSFFTMQNKSFLSLFLPQQFDPKK
jgi:hypothetical protein